MHSILISPISSKKYLFSSSNLSHKLIKSSFRKHISIFDSLNFHDQLCNNTCRFLKKLVYATSFVLKDNDLIFKCLR